MASGGQPTANAFGERLIQTLKEEAGRRHDYQDCEEARSRIGRCLEEVSRTKRVHSALGYVTPAEFKAA